MYRLFLPILMACLLSACGSSSSSESDSDGDGVFDGKDAFPNDASETLDSDGDGVGDNSDIFPNDASEAVDSDGDGTGDNSDAFVNDPAEYLDSDLDGLGDNADAFPNDANEAVDSDGDGIGDNSDEYPNDFDNDSVPDLSDAFPQDPNETADSDGDGVGDNSDAFPNIASESQDSDGDGIGDNADPFPNGASTAISPIFNPIAGVLPLGIDFYFTGTPDGTAHAGMNNVNPVISATNDLDGGISVLAPIDVAMSGSIDSSSVVAGNSVYLVKLPNAKDAVTYDLILPDGITAADIDALDLSSLTNFLAVTKQDGSDPADVTESIIFRNFPSILAMQPTAGIDYEVSVISLDDGTDNTIRINPLKPLDAKCKYIVLITDAISGLATEAGAGQAIQASDGYSYISGHDELISPAFESVRSAIQSWESLANVIITVAGADPTRLDGDIVFTSAFTTSDPQAVLKSMAYPGYWVASDIVKNNETIATGILAGAVTAGILTQEAADGLTESGQAIATAEIIVSGVLTTDIGSGEAYSHPRARSFELIKNVGGQNPHQIPVSTLTNGALTDNVLISQGAIELPQYTQALSESSDDYWQASTSVGSVIDNLIGNAQGSTPIEDINGSQNVTYRFPFAMEVKNTVVPLMMFEPTSNSIATALAANDGDDETSQATYLNTGPAGTGCGEKPAAGWPVTIMQHGYSSERSASIITASKIVDLTCHVVIAMDLPHHGIAAESASLSLSVDYVDTTTSSLTPFSAAKEAYVAAVDLDATILDDLAERHEGLYMANGEITDMNYDDIKAGDSGSLWMRLENFQRTRDNMRQAVMDLLNLNASLGVIDVNGDDIADLDVSNVNFVGHSLGAIVGTTFVAVNNDEKILAGNSNLNRIQKLILANPGGGLAKMLENSVLMGPQLISGLGAEGLNQGDSGFESFINVLQASVDSVDPTNFVADLAVGGSSETPTLVIEIVGDGTVSSPSDLVVPNNATGEFLADNSIRPESAQSLLVGSDPMIRLLGADNVMSESQSDQLVASYNAGGHGTFFSAGSDSAVDAYDSTEAYVEMLLQSIQFLLNGVITPVNSEVLSAGN